MTVLIVPEAMAPELRRYIAHNGRVYQVQAQGNRIKKPLTWNAHQARM